jgi:putative MATE family efflux protein
VSKGETVNRSTLLEAPITPTLVKLAWPILVVLAVQTAVGVAETYFVSFLGAAAVAGVAIVFPLFMLMTMMSNGGIGGGVSSAIARAIGGGRADDANSLVLHALIIAVVFGAMFSAAAWIGGPALYRSMGAEGDAFANAQLYSNLIFAAAIPAWITNVLASTLRGAGNVRVPAIVTIVGAISTLALSPLLIFGWGIVPSMGVAGAGAAMILFNVAAAAALILYLRSAKSPVQLRAAALRWRLFKDILKVGLLSAVGTVVANLTIVATTGLVGRFGTDAIAGYGLASRLDYLLIPLLFALGTATVTMIGTNTGAGLHQRARRIAWTAALISAGATGAIGFAATVAPHAWIGLFSSDAGVMDAGIAYLQRAAPFYAFLGLGMALYFASQGFGKMAWPITAGLARLLTVVLVGSLWVEAFSGSLTDLFWIAGASQILFGVINAFGMIRGAGLPAPPGFAAAKPIFRS